MSEANVHNAAGAYIVAAAHYYGVPERDIDQPGRDNVEEIEENIFQINPPQERDKHGHFVGPLAVCRYDEDDQKWKVEVRTGNQPGVDSDIVIVDWDEEQETYIVVG